jgi:two-component system, NtrC family, response regulator AtoC
MASRRQTPPATTVRSVGAADRAGASTACVLLVAGPSALVTRSLDREIVIGRDPGCDIPLDSPKISRRHARVLAGPPVTVQDLGSTNGVRVRGTKHVGGAPVTLEVGDAFQVGPFSVLLLPGGGDSKPAAEPRARLVVEDPTPEGVHPTITRIAASEINLLIHGETGAGKEVLARTVHQLSKRRGPFLALNCAAVHEGLLESELFGHERGAFTGATQAKPGLLESAAGGTVFLDEIGDLPAAIQAKLLRVLEAREVFRLGSVKPVSLDVRFVAATHRALRDEVARGAFREDLYYRLNGVTLVVPPLRDRKNAILPLAQRLLADAAKRAGVRPPGIAADAAAALQGHSWPGNVRELRTVLERAILLGDGGELRAAHLVLEPPIGTGGAAASDLSPAEAAERDKIIAALDAAAGNQTRAAKALGISRATLVNKLAIYRIARPRGR